MIRALKITYILVITGLLVFACKQTKYVPDGKYLLKKNKIEVQDGKLNEEDVAEIIRQKPNYKTVGIKLRLMAFNSVDSTKVAQKRVVKNRELREKNKKRIDKRDKINNRRIKKAREQGKDLYTEKLVKLKDTINPKMFFREWFKYKIGEAPVILDSAAFKKSVDQLKVYLKNKGYYYGSVKGYIDYHENKKATARFILNPGKQYIIDSTYVIAKNDVVAAIYRGYLKEHPEQTLINQPFDKDNLDSYRDKVARYMRDHELYGFSSSHINMVADTTYATMKVILAIRFTDRMIKSPYNKDSLIAVKHKLTRVNDVYFHIADTTYFEGNFKATVEEMGLTVLDQQFIRTIDTFYYAEIKKKGQLDTLRFATFLYNGELKIKPGIIELQSYLEHTNKYKEYYLERSFTRLMQLDIFQVIKPVIIEIPGTNKIDVHYYLVPSKKQSIGFEPRATNSNGFLGVAATINYTNKNLFRGAEKMTLSVSGGFESQPPVFDENLEGDKVKKAGRSFNTFEIGPSIKFELPGLFPTKATLLGKRSRPRTVLSTAYNYQLRSDFERHVFQLNYLWKFYVAKTQIFQVGLPFASVIKLVRIDKTEDFQNRLDQLNDLFLKNTYSNQFIWQDARLTFEFNNKDQDLDKKKTNFFIYTNSSFDLAGNTLSLFKNYQDTLDGQRTIFGVGYSQFARMDNEFILGHSLGKKKSIHGRLQLGGGIPYGNTTTAMPYDYSFFGGGSNDNRGWRARSLGPGSYKYYLDTNRTATQVGDMRIGGSVEFRFVLGPLLRGAVFVDAGNIWTFNADTNRSGSQFSKYWINEIALSGGVGLRMDLDFFILRLDIGVPITNPALPKGARWIFQERQPYYDEGIAEFGTILYKKYLPKPFTPNIHFGIGYPF